MSQQFGESVKSLIPGFAKKQLKEAMHSYREITPKNRLAPEMIVIGAQKCGTSSLYNYLAQHPELVPAFKKEIHYFDSGLKREHENFHRGENWYLAHFPNRESAIEGGISFEASPMYFFHPLVPRRISEFNPSMKLVLMVRNPTMRAISHYYHEVKNGRESLPLLGAMEAEFERTEAVFKRNDYWDPAFKNFTYKARGRYAEQLKRYLEYFQRDNIHIICSEEFFADPQTSLEALYDFLGVDMSFQVPDLSPVNVSNAKKEVGDEVLGYLDDYFARYNEEFFKIANVSFDW